MPLETATSSAPCPSVYTGGGSTTPSPSGLASSRPRANARMAGRRARAPRLAARSSRYRLALARPHHLQLELLVERVHAPEKRARPAVADLAPVELDDREHFLGRGAHPELVGDAHLGLRDVAQLD